VKVMIGGITGWADEGYAFADDHAVGAAAAASCKAAALHQAVPADRTSESGCQE
jgi:hypothetical protein